MSDAGDTAGAGDAGDAGGLAEATGFGGAGGMAEATGFGGGGEGAASRVAWPLRRMPSSRPSPGRQRAVIGRCTAGGMNGRATIDGAGWFLPGAAVDGLRPWLSG
jgi:hypothetical protein